jgi:ComF family protein
MRQLRRAGGTSGRTCAACFGGVGFITRPFCARCGVPFAAAEQAGRDGACPTCQENPPRFGAARAALRYDMAGRRLILPLKHGDRTELVRTLAPQMARAGAELLQRADLLIPVPLHRRRLFKRRYNQAGLLASAVSKIGGVPALLDGLKRLRATPALEEKSPAERMAAVEDAFAVRTSRAARIVGRRILLIDDVMTSGATANSCTKVLFEAGAAAVDVLTAARVPDRRFS